MLTRILADTFRGLGELRVPPGQVVPSLGDNGGGQEQPIRGPQENRDLIVRGVPAANLFQETQTRWDTRDVPSDRVGFEGGKESFNTPLRSSTSKVPPRSKFIPTYTQAAAVFLQSQIRHQIRIDSPEAQ